MSTETKTKKPRASAHVWKRFYRVGRTDTFFIGKTKLTKTGYITAVIASSGNVRFVNPLKRVRTAELVHPKLAPWPHGMGQTIRPAVWETQGGTTPEQNEAHFSQPKPFVQPPSPEIRGTTDQPTSDNGITGPTS